MICSRRRWMTWFFAILVVSGLCVLLAKTPAAKPVFDSLPEMPEMPDREELVKDIMEFIHIPSEEEIEAQRLVDEMFQRQKEEHEALKAERLERERKWKEGELEEARYERQFAKQGEQGAILDALERIENRQEVPKAAPKPAESNAMHKGDPIPNQASDNNNNNNNNNKPAAGFETVKEQAGEGTRPRHFRQPLDFKPAGDVYPFRMSSDKAVTKLHDLIAARQNPAHCVPENMLRCPARGQNGFGYQLHQIAACLLDAFREGKVAVFSGPVNGEGALGRYGQEENAGWETWFQPISSCQSMNGQVVEEWNENTYARKDWLPEYTPKQMKNPGAWVVGSAIKYLLRPSDRLAAILKEKGQPADFGAHIRLTDKITMKEAWAHGIEQYMQALDRVTNTGWNFHSAYGRDYKKSVFVATDEPSIYNGMASYPQYKMMHGDGADLPRYSRAGLDSFLVELFTLANTEYFVGTYSSQVSRLVYELYHVRYMDAYERSWSLDDPWYGVNYSMLFPDA